MMQTQRLYYVYDPMCSWCWGFKQTFETLKKMLDPSLEVIYVLGGLAPDSNVPMEEEMKTLLQEAWKKVAAHTGAKFNHDFWKECEPRRSTYPACRAVIAAKEWGKEEAMVTALQEAYYLRAMNPSDVATHLILAKELGVEVEPFEERLRSAETEEALQKDIALARRLGVKGFPSLILQVNGRIIPLQIDYKDALAMHLAIQTLS